MNELLSPKRALVSVFDKSDLAPLIKCLTHFNIEIVSTGGTQKFIEEMGVPVTPVEELTGYPSILGGRVKTLHPKIFGGILNRRNLADDQQQIQEYDIPAIDIVIVDLYPFEDTVAQGGTENEIIEKIDIGGISLIRAAAKNFADVLIVSNREQYTRATEILTNGDGKISLADRKTFAREAFQVSSGYDQAIQSWFGGEQSRYPLRYGENPHQKGYFAGKLDDILEQHHGKDLSYNNLLDIEATLSLIREFDETTFVVVKHNNACGLASRNSLLQAWKDALAGDPVSAFGGVIACNRKLDVATAREIDGLFIEVMIAPAYEAEALEILKSKKNRILLTYKDFEWPRWQERSILNGKLVQERDLQTDSVADLKPVTKVHPNSEVVEDLIFASKICKHTKSNTIILAKNKQLLGGGTGQTSRVDALKHAIEKAKNFNFDLSGAVMASDAFFPFPDCVEIAWKSGVRSVIQPGGSVKDQLSIDFCDQNDMSMVFTGTRHFKH